MSIPATITVATYECGAVRHMIDEWLLAMEGRIHHWFTWKGVEIARIDGDGGKEWLYIIPVVEGRLDPALVVTVVQDCCTERFDKLLHFGKVPTRDSAWHLLMEMVR